MQREEMGKRERPCTGEGGTGEGERRGKRGERTVQVVASAVEPQLSSRHDVLTNFSFTDFYG